MAIFAGLPLTVQLSADDGCSLGSDTGAPKNGEDGRSYRNNIEQKLLLRTKYEKPNAYENIKI